MWLVVLVTCSPIIGLSLVAWWVSRDSTIAWLKSRRLNRELRKLTKRG